MEKIQADTQLKQVVQHFTIDFLESGFNNLVETLVGLMNQQDDWDDQDKIHLYYLIYFGMLSNAYLNSQEIKIEWIFAAVECNTFISSYQQLVNIFDKKPKEQNNALLYMIVKYMIELIDLIKRMMIDSQQVHRQNGEFLLGTILRHDVGKMLKQGLQMESAGLKDFDEQLFRMIEVYLDSIDIFSRGRIINIEIKKQKVADESDDDQLVEEQEQFVYQSKQSSLQQELSLLLIPPIITKAVDLLADFSSLQFSSSIFKFFQRAIQLLDSTYLFFQIDYFLKFQQFLESIDYNHKQSRKLEPFIIKIVREYFKVLKNNKMLIIESLFRFYDDGTKSRIYNWEVIQNELKSDQQRVYYKEWSDKETSIICKILNSKQVNSIEISELRSSILNIGIVDKTYIEIQRYLQQLNKLNKQHDIQLYKYEDQQILEKLLKYVLQCLENFLQDTQVDLPLIAIEDEHFGVLEWSEFNSVMQFLEIRRPSQNERYYRISKETDPDNLLLKIEKMKSHNQIEDKN